ncbi:MAG: DUF1015 domain-containing protein [Thermoflexibacter sp.]
MADIRPFSAWRYNDFLIPNINQLTAPLFDVVSEAQRQKLYHQPYNSIHLSVPLLQNGKSAGEVALTTLEKWKKEGIIIQDKKPAIYVYYQYFSLPEHTETLCRKGFICMMRVYEWEDKILLRHENTIPHAVNDRVELLERTQLHTSPTHGIYTDQEHLLEKYMDKAMENPIYQTEDYQGVRDVLARIEDKQTIQIFMNHLKNKQIILADGHHRYESSLLLKHKQMKKNPLTTGEEGYHFHLIFLTNSESGDLKVLPTHRLLKNFANFNKDTFLENLAKYFTVKSVDRVFDLNEIINGKKWTFGVIFKDSAFKITLNESSLQEISWDFPQIIKELDLTVLHYFIFQKALGIEGKMQRSSPYIYYERNFTECVTEVLQGKSQAAFIVNPVTITQIKQVCQSGYTLPQKSTYFYPKVISGFVFGSIEGMI